MSVLQEANRRPGHRQAESPCLAREHLDFLPAQHVPQVNAAFLSAVSDGRCQHRPLGGESDGRHAAITPFRNGVQGNGRPPLLVPAQLDAVVLPPLLVTQLALEVLDLAAKIPEFAEQLVAAGAGLLGRGDGLLDLVGVLPARRGVPVKRLGPAPLTHSAFRRFRGICNRAPG